MIQARFVYQNELYGEWVTAVPDNPDMRPNEEFKELLLSVQFRNIDEPAPPAHEAHRRSRAKNKQSQRFRTIIPNGAS